LIDLLINSDQSQEQTTFLNKFSKLLSGIPHST